MCRSFLGLTSGGGSVASSSVLMLTKTSHGIGRRVGLRCLRMADNINIHSMTDLKLGVDKRRFRTTTANGKPISTTVGTIGRVVGHRVALGRFAVRTVDGNDSSINGMRVRIRCSNRVCCNFNTGASVVTTSMRTCVSYVGGFEGWWVGQRACNWCVVQRGVKYARHTRNKEQACPIMCQPSMLS